MIVLTPTPKTQIILLRSGEKIIADIKQDYGNYLDEDIHGNEITRNNTAYETLVINSKNLSYAKKRAVAYWSRHF